ncbi:MAG: protealysin inhibitor emfourin [Mycetocola sp.]
MKVTVTRSGGFAGIARRWQVFVESEPDEESWILLLRQLPWDDVPQEPAQPDRYLYRINCEPRQTAQDDAEPSNRRENVIGQPREAVIPEQRLTGPWRELVDRVRERDEQENERRPSHPSHSDR